MWGDLAALEQRRMRASAPQTGSRETLSYAPHLCEAKKNGFCQQLCFDGSCTALSRGLCLTPVCPEPGWIWEAPICGSRPWLCPVGARSVGVHKLPDGNVSRRRAHASSDQQVSATPGPASSKRGPISCRFGSIRRHCPFSIPRPKTCIQNTGQRYHPSA